MNGQDSFIQRDPMLPPLFCALILFVQLLSIPPTVQIRHPRRNHVPPDLRDHMPIIQGDTARLTKKDTGKSPDLRDHVPFVVRRHGTSAYQKKDTGKILKEMTTSLLGPPVARLE